MENWHSRASVELRLVGQTYNHASAMLPSHEQRTEGYIAKLLDGKVNTCDSINIIGISQLLEVKAWTFGRKSFLPAIPWWSQKLPMSLLCDPYFVLETSQPTSGLAEVAWVVPFYLWFSTADSLYVSISRVCSHQQRSANSWECDQCTGGPKAKILSCPLPAV